MSAFKKNSHGIHLIETPQDIKNRACLDEQEVLKLADLGNQIEKIFGSPQDIEWAIKDKEIFILQSRPITSVRRDKKCR
jgi:phosphoenolpyruvate synthase/pyruvate phosphate dikinase